MNTIKRTEGWKGWMSQAVAAYIAYMALQALNAELPQLVQTLAAADLHWAGRLLNASPWLIAAVGIGLAHWLWRLARERKAEVGYLGLTGGFLLLPVLDIARDTAQIALVWLAAKTTPEAGLSLMTATAPVLEAARLGIGVLGIVWIGWMAAWLVRQGVRRLRAAPATAGAGFPRTSGDSPARSCGPARLNRVPPLARG